MGRKPVLRPPRGCSRRNRIPRDYFRNRLFAGICRRCKIRDFSGTRIPGAAGPGACDSGARTWASRSYGVGLEQMERLVPKEATASCSPGMIIKFGSPAECILEAAAERNADLIVLGVRSAGPHLAAATHFTRAIAHQIVAQACCPVLTIHHK